LTDNEGYGGAEHGPEDGLPLPVGFAAPAAGERGEGWVWTSGEPFRFQAWARGEPNNSGGDEDAGLVRSDGGWNDDSLGAMHASVIEHDLPSLPTDLFKVTLVKQYNGVTNLAMADAVLAGRVPSVQTSGQIPLFDLLDSGDPGYVGFNFPVPGVSDADHFVSLSVAPLDVQSAGVYTFALASDDGGRLVLDGQTIAEFFGSRGFSSTVSVPVDLSAGAHDLQVVWFQNVGGAGAEVGYAPGSEAYLNPNFTVLGDPSKGIALSSLIDTTTYDVQLETAYGLEFGQGLTAPEAADKLLDGTTPGAAWHFFSDTVNFNDLEDPQTGDEFADDDPFPGLMETDQDRFILQASGFVQVTEEDDYTFGLRLDDGARLRIDGVELINQPNFGTVLANIHLAPGLHALDLVMGDDDGRGTIELFAARGIYSTFDANAFHLVGDTVNGGLRITQRGPAMPEPSAAVLLALAACSLAGWATRRRGQSGDEPTGPR
jgi:PA14 domain